MTETNNSQTRWLNFSYATRNPDITIDETLYKQHDTYLPKLLKVSRVALAVAVVFAALTVKFFLDGSWLLAIPIGSAAIVALFFSSASVRAGGGTAYESELLIPAIITDTNPTQIIALANISSKDDEKSGSEHVQWAAKRINLPSLPLHQHTVGQRVPCAAIFGGSRNDLRLAFEPRPLSWATSSIEEIKHNEGMIPQVEWDFLEKITNKVPDHAEDNIALFDHDGNFERTVR